MILTHITDVGAPSGDGSDSIERIRKQYFRLGVEPRIVTAGQSPLHVAFTACTDLEPNARDVASQILTRLGRFPNSLPPTALNSAPRNATQCVPNGKEDYIYRARHPGLETLLIYGREVLSWVLTFRGRIGAEVESIIEIVGIIPDTSKGSQFRSAEDLPAVHVLEDVGKLDDNSRRESVNIDEVPSLDPAGTDFVLVLPLDEYSNGRLLVGRDMFDEILTNDSIRLPEVLNDRSVAVRPSLTDVEPYQKTGQFAVWPSSNHFSGGRHGVLNIGTRWQAGQTSTVVPDVLKLADELRRQVGKNLMISLDKAS